MPDTVLAELVQRCGASIGMMFLLPRGERTLHLALVSGLSEQIVAPWTRIPLDSAVPVADAVRRRRLIWLRSQEEIARRYPRVGAVLPYDFMTAAVPIADDTTVWGGFVLVWPTWHPPQLSPKERQTISGCCLRAAALLHEAADAGQPWQTAEGPRRVPAQPPSKADPAQAQATLTFTERLPVGCCALDLDGRLTFINSAGADLMGAGAASLLGRRPWEVLLWLHEPLFEDRYRAAVVSRQPTSFTARSPYGSRLLFELFPDDSGVSVHITRQAAVQDTTVGRTAAPRSPTDIVGAAGLYQLTHLAITLAEAVSVQDVVDLVADQIVPAFGPRGVLVMNAEEGRLSSLGHRNCNRDFVEQFDARPVSSALPTAQVLETGEPMFITSYEELCRTHPAVFRNDDSNAWGFLPLTVSGRTRGALILSYDQPRSFPPAERAILTSLAGLIAQALERARLYDAKHTLARTLQISLLPRTLPRIPGLQTAARYQSAGYGMDIGGDFYDLISPTPTTAVAAIGDVQGHNTAAAAAVMAQIRTAVHTHAAAGDTAASILARTNRLLSDLGSGLFASCLIAHLDPARHRAHLSAAGHPPALLRHPDGRTDILRIPPGLLLGINPNTDYTATEIPFPPGAVLALYTDGLVESPSADIDQTTTALADLLREAPANDLNDLSETVLHRTGRASTPADDIALLLIRATTDDSAV